MSALGQKQDIDSPLSHWHMAIRGFMAVLWRSNERQNGSHGFSQRMTSYVAQEVLFVRQA